MSFRRVSLFGRNVSLIAAFRIVLLSAALSGCSDDPAEILVPAQAQADSAAAGPTRIARRVRGGNDSLPDLKPLVLAGASLSIEGFTMEALMDYTHEQANGSEHNRYIRDSLVKVTFGTRSVFTGPKEVQTTRDGSGLRVEAHSLYVKDSSISGNAPMYVRARQETVLRVYLDLDTGARRVRSGSIAFSRDTVYSEKLSGHTYGSRRDSVRFSLALNDLPYSESGDSIIVEAHGDGLEAREFARLQTYNGAPLPGQTYNDVGRWRFVRDLPALGTRTLRVAVKK